jgi:hypothetical protein
LFRAVIEILGDPDKVQALKVHLGESTFEKLRIESASTATATATATMTMTAVNRILVDPGARTWLFGAIGCPCSSSFPTFDELLLYGGLSPFIHRTSHKAILVSSRADDETKQFWRCVGTWTGRRVKQFDEVFAAAGSDIVNGDSAEETAGDVVEVTEITAGNGAVLL